MLWALIKVYLHLNASSGILFASFCILMPVFLQLIHTSGLITHECTYPFQENRSLDGKLERILNWKIAQKSYGQPQVYATTCDESGIICAYFLLLFTFYST